MAVKKTYGALIHFYNAYFRPKTKKAQIGRYILSMPGSHALPHYLKTNPEYSANFPRLTKVVKDFYSDLSIIDIGANIGDTVALVRSTIECPILCIEPNETYYKFLVQNTTQFNDVTLFQVTLDETPQIIKGVLKSSEGSAKIEKDNVFSNNITTTTLDTLLKEHSEFSQAKLLKIDTDGYDLKIIRGAKEYLTKKQPILFFEFDRYLLAQCNDAGLPTIQLLKNIGYNTIMFYDNRGRFLLSTTLEQTSLIEQLYNYTYKKEGSFPYYDVCLFHTKDEELAQVFIQQEMKHQHENSLRSSNIQ